jgi:hypothetical protein
VALRPATVVLLFPVGLYLLLPGRLAGWRGYLAAVAGIVLLPLLMAVANSLMFGHWYATGYPPSQYRDSWRNFWPEGAAGLLIAPNSGLFVQSPFTLLALVGGWQVWRGAEAVRDRGLLRAYTLCFLLYWGLFAKWYDWQGGLVFATRMLSEGYPLWLPLVVIGWKSVRGYPHALLVVTVLCAYSVVYQLVNLALFDRTTLLNPKHLPWSPRDHFFVFHVRHFGMYETVGSILLSGCLFLVIASLLVVVLRPFLRQGLPGAGKIPEKE